VSFVQIIAVKAIYWLRLKIIHFYEIWIIFGRGIPAKIYYKFVKVIKRDSVKL